MAKNLSGRDKEPIDSRYLPYVRYIFLGREGNISGKYGKHNKPPIF